MCVCVCARLRGSACEFRLDFTVDLVMKGLTTIHSHNDTPKTVLPHKLGNTYAHLVCYVVL